VSFDVLIAKLEKYNFSADSCSLMRSYLSDRVQSVKIANDASKSLPIEQGVPQGSILGPILFLIYINDFIPYMSGVHVVQFADDTTLVSADRSLHEAREKMNLAILLATDWFNSNRLILNNAKTVQVLFTLRNHDQIDAPGTTFLGMHLDSAGQSWGGNGK